MTLKDSFNRCVELLKEEGFTLHFKRSYSSKSLYLKVEWGLGGSIRFSDHQDYGLSYSFNVQEGITEKEVVEENGVQRIYYPIGGEEDLLKDVKEKYNSNKEKYGDYMENVIRKIQREAEMGKKSGKGFWAGAKKIN